MEQEFSPFFPHPSRFQPARRKEKGLGAKKRFIEFSSFSCQTGGGGEDKGGGPRIDVRPYSAILSSLKVGPPPTSNPAGKTILPQSSFVPPLWEEGFCTKKGPTVGGNFKGFGKKESLPSVASHTDIQETYPVQCTARLPASQREWRSRLPIRPAIQMPRCLCKKEKKTLKKKQGSIRFLCRRRTRKKGWEKGESFQSAGVRGEYVAA